MFAKAGVTPAEMEGFFAHGTTVVVINAMTERKGVFTGLITTAAFGDVLEIARGNRPDFFNLAYAESRNPLRAAGTVSARWAAGWRIIAGVETGGARSFAARGDRRRFPRRRGQRPQGRRVAAACLCRIRAHGVRARAVIARLHELMPEAGLVAAHQMHSRMA